MLVFILCFLVSSAIFEKQQTQADIMKAVILLLKELVKQLGAKYENNDEHMKTQIEDLLLDICTDLRVPREVMDEVSCLSTYTHTHTQAHMHAHKDTDGGFFVGYLQLMRQ